MRNVVAVIGTTGVGKSALAVRLAESLPAPRLVVSADSMQLYKGLDLITNKVTKEEMRGVPHWGIGIVDPTESWEVGRWCTEADEQIASTSAVPIICGGTHYFIQHFLFPPGEISFERDGPWRPPGPRPAVTLDQQMQDLLDTFYTPEPLYPSDNHLMDLYNLLHLVDPAEAGRWHWKDGRKVRRGLERWWEGTKATTTIRQARFRTLIFWVYEPMETLSPRLDKRIDMMIENGLLDEVAELESLSGDTTTGIFQSIGYKEFAHLKGDIAPAVERMKQSTQRYAKSQIKWIRKQLLPAAREAQQNGGEVYIYVVKSDSEVTGILKGFLDGGDLPTPSEIHPDADELLDAPSSVPDTALRQKLNERRICGICSESEPFSVMLRDWDQHERSKLHKRNVYYASGGREKRLAEIEELRRSAQTK